MDVTPGTPEKRTRAKVKETAAQNAKPTIVTKKPRAARKAAVAEVVAPAATRTLPTTSGADLEGMIATAAYYIAAERNFAPGHELDDWLEAERRIRTTLFG